MTAEPLEDALVAELQKLFEGVCFLAPTGKLEQIQVFKYDLPVQMAGATNRHEPFIAVCPVTGQIAEAGDLPETDVGLGIRIWNNAPEHTGNDDLMSIIRRIVLRFTSNPYISNRHYECKYPIKWSLSDTSRHPYYIGAVAFKVENAQPIYQEVPSDGSF